MEKKTGVTAGVFGKGGGKKAKGIKGAGRTTGNKTENKTMWMIRALLCAYVVTGILLLILTFLLYQTGLSEENVNAGITLIYVISTFSAGFVMGRLTGTRKFLWGLLAGCVYFALLLVISLGVYRSFQTEPLSAATTFLLCAGGGMLGGMIA